MQVSVPPGLITLDRVHLHKRSVYAMHQAQWEWVWDAAGCWWAWIRTPASITEVHCATSVQYSLPRWSAFEFEECGKPDDRQLDTCRQLRHQTAQKHWSPLQLVSVNSRVRLCRATSQTRTSLDHPWHFSATAATGLGSLTLNLLMHQRDVFGFVGQFWLALLWDGASWPLAAVQNQCYCLPRRLHIQ